MKPSRRECLAAVGAAVLIQPWRAAAESVGRSVPPISTNTYPWLTFARRAGQQFQIHSDELLASIASAGISGYEPIINQAAEFDGLGQRLQKHGLIMESIYVNSTLHDADVVDKSVEDVLAIADGAKKLGVKIIVTNPSPIRWGGPENKTDAQLRLQARSLDRLGAELRQREIALAYHNHDAELREGGREFHHMLTATDPQNVKFCLDAHWVFRGCGDSEVAVFDALTHYHSRIVELHLRQSMDGVWLEAFSMEGDIDYSRLFKFLAKREIAPHLVLEQAIEAESSNDMTATQAHRRGRAKLVEYLS